MFDWLEIGLDLKWSCAFRLSSNTGCFLMNVLRKRRSQRLKKRNEQRRKKNSKMNLTKGFLRRQKSTLKNS
jgi:predicted Co/Zn/Cd cation transporter (cation efflux family)